MAGKIVNSKITGWQRMCARRCCEPFAIYRPKCTGLPPLALMSHERP